MSTHLSTVSRYALYYAPRPEEGLAVAASQWLGWNPEPGHGRPLPLSSGIDTQRLLEITAEPRRYGFHGTLKAPFALAEGRSAHELDEAVERFARHRAPFGITLRMGSLDGFIELVPAAASAALDGLAADCVEAFDGFRRPLRGRSSDSTSGSHSPSQAWGL